jgi:hypothetical protein
MERIQIAMMVGDGVVLMDMSVEDFNYLVKEGEKICKGIQVENEAKGKN